MQCKYLVTFDLVLLPILYTYMTQWSNKSLNCGLVYDFVHAHVDIIATSEFGDAKYELHWLE